MAAPKLPASVKVGHLDFSIVVVPSADIGAYGDCHYDEQRIRIAADQKPQTMAETVLHEVLHACWPDHLKGAGGPEEAIVTALSPSLCQIWRDNQDLVAWLSHNLK